MTDLPPLRDYSRSRAIVVGTWEYAFLDRVPAAEQSLRRMARLLTGPLCGWPRDRLLLVKNKPSPGDLPDRLITAFDGISDVALFYFVGHGQIAPDDQLCLGLVQSRLEANRRAATSLRFSDVRQALQDSEAAVKIVILDCCFAGLATAGPGALAGLAGDVLALTAGTGAYTMAATSAYATAWYQDDPGLARPQTYFTKYLADLVEHGIPGQPSRLPLDALFKQLRENLAADQRPVPQSRAVNDARDFEFAYNAAPPELHIDRDREIRNLTLRLAEAEARLDEATTAHSAAQAALSSPAPGPNPRTSRRRRNPWLRPTGAGIITVIVTAVSLAAFLKSDHHGPDRPPGTPTPTATRTGAQTPTPTPTPTVPLSATISPDGSLADKYTTDIQDIAFSPDSTTIASFSSASAIEYPNTCKNPNTCPWVDGIISLWNLATPHAYNLLLYTSKGPTNPRQIGGLAFSPDGKHLLTGGGAGTLQVFDLKDEGGAKVNQDPDNRGISAVAYSPDGKTIAEGNLDGNIHLLNLSTGKWTQSFKDPAFGTTNADIINQIAFGSTSGVLAISDINGYVYAWNRGNGSSPIPFQSGVSGTSDAITFSPHSPTLAVAKYGMQLWNVATSQDIGWTKGVDTAPEAESFGTPGGTILAVGDADGGIYLWDVSSQDITLLTTIHCPITSWGGLAFSTSGQYLAAYAKSGTKIYLYKVKYSY